MVLYVEHLCVRQNFYRAYQDIQYQVDNWLSCTTNNDRKWRFYKGFCWFF